ncbi:MAG: tetratricopeptide repeat protein [Bacillota bacterium]
MKLPRPVSVLLALAALAACASAPPAPAGWKTLQAKRQALEDKAQFVPALAAAKDEYAAAQKTLPADSAEMTEALNDLAAAELDVGNYPEAESYFRLALNLEQKRHGAGSAEAAMGQRLIARAESSQGRFEDAEKDLTAVLAAQEKLLGPADPEVAATLGDLAMVEYNLNKMDAASQDYQRALAIQETAPGKDQEDLAETLTGQGLLLLVNGDNAGARKVLNRALAILDKPGRPQTPALAYAIDYLGNVDLNEGHPAEAEPLFLRALQIMREAQGPETPDVANMLNDVARSYDDQGLYNKALPYYQQSLDVYVKTQGEMSANVGQVEGSIAYMYEVFGDYNRAESLYRRALEIDRKVRGEDDIQVGYDLNNMAVLYREMGRVKDAIPFMQQTIAIFEKVYPPDHPNTATALSNLAVLYNNLSQWKEAQDLAEKALAMDQRTLGPVHPQVAHQMNILADIYDHEHRTAEAEKLYLDAMAMDMKTLGPDQTDTAQQSVNVGEFYAFHNRLAEARPLFERALPVVMKVNGEQSAMAITVQFKYSMLLFQMGDRKAAAPVLDASMEKLHHDLESQFVYMNERDRLQFLNSIADRFPEYYSFCLKYHEQDPALAGKMYNVLLWQKGFVGNTITALRAKIASSGDPDSLALLDKLSASKTKLATLLNNPGQDRDQWLAKVQQQQADTDDLERQLAKRSAAVAEGQRLQSVTWQQVRDALKPGEAAVEVVRFHYMEGWLDTHENYYVALVVTPETRDQPQFIVIGKAAGLESDPVADYAARLRKAGPAPLPGQTTFYEAYWAPLEPALKGATRVYLSPDGVFNQASLGIVPDPAGKLLMERYDLRIVPSTKDVLRHVTGATSEDAVLMGGPSFDLPAADYLAAVGKLGGGTNDTRLAARTQVSIPVARGAEAAHCPLPDTGILCPLPGTAEEVAGIDALLSRKQWQARLYQSDLALEEAIKSVHHPRLLHIATHGFFLPDQKNLVEDPMLRSGLYFAGADNTLAGNPSPEGADDGVLTAYEAEQLDLEGTELVVLSACDTGLGSSQNGEGVFGLNRALQEAGAQAVIMSMWSVPDQETRELMQFFYANWLGGMEKHEALRQAELKEREVVKARYSQDLPYYWGAFVMVGQ